MLRCYRLWYRERVRFDMMNLCCSSDFVLIHRRFLNVEDVHCRRNVLNFGSKYARKYYLMEEIG
jgi:hypothetical protein